jgi:ABC-type nitrate/sulfonate/bicarbonate transport system ATPase subunit
MKSVLITTKQVSRIFSDNDSNVLALSNVNLTVHEGEFLMLVGPSGCGKSTLLRILAGLDKPTTGEVTFGKQIRPGFVFQDFALFPWLTVYQNIEFGLKMEGKAVNERKKTTLKYAEFMGLEKFLESYPHELSGGMRQRVGIARALAINPEIVFLDEPFSALDSFTAQKLRKELLELWKKHGTTFVMVTHLVEEAVQLGTRIAVFSQRPGTVEKVFENSLSFPRNLRSEHFFALVDKITDQVAI